MRTIAVLSLAGGQGKTTTAVLLSLLLSRQGKRVLAVDADPQRNLTLYLGIEIGKDRPTLLEFLRKEVDPPENAIYPVEAEENLYVIPADRALKQAVSYLSGIGTGALLLRNRLKALAELFDYCIIDAQPSDSQIVMSVAGAADLVLIPAEANSKGVGSLADTLNFLEVQTENLGFEGKILGVLPFRDKWTGRNRTKESQDAIAAFGEIVGGEGLEIFPSVRESEKYKAAFRAKALPSEFGERYKDLDYPFEQIAQRLEEK